MEASVAAVPENATLESILLDMVNLLPDWKADQKARLDELAGWLLAMVQEDLQMCKQTAKQRGLSWEGKLDLFGSMREQDGNNWGHTDSVVIKEGATTLMTKGSDGCKGVVEEYTTSVTLQNGESALKHALHKVSKRFESPRSEILICEINVDFSANNEISRIVAKRNTDSPPQKEGSFYYRPLEKFVTHELYLS